MRSRVYETVERPSVRLPVCPVIRLPHAAAAGLLLCARRPGDIDRLLHGAGAQQQMPVVSRCQLTYGKPSTDFSFLLFLSSVNSLSPEVHACARYRILASPQLQYTTTGMRPVRST